MELKRRVFPLGTSDFKDIRVEGLKYVDKTMYIPLLSRYGKVLLFTRPRRFGKSLAISTLDSFYSGDKELFKGLAVEEIMNSPEFDPRPVIRLLMSRPSGAVSKGDLKNKIISELTENAERHKVTPHGVDAAGTLINLIKDVSEANSNKKVVLLVDEYDAPVIKVIQDPALSKIEGLLRATRSVMSNFYSKIKDLDRYLDFVFITGITKYTQTSIYSGFNNLRDISLKPEFAPFAGFTQEELENNFRPFIRRTADKLKLSEAELLAKIQGHYYGFSFDGETRLYNSEAILHFFQDMEFNGYWAESGSNAVIREIIKDKHLTVEQFSGLKVSPGFIHNPGEIDETPPEGFLYQAGYLTPRKDPDSESSHFLDYPNFEVRSSMARLFMDIVFGSEIKAGGALIKLQKHFDAGDVAGIVDDFSCLFSSITYNDHTAGVRLNLFLATIKDDRSSLTSLIDDSVGRGLRWELSWKISDDIENKNYRNANDAIEDLLKNSPAHEEIRLKIGECFYRSYLRSFLLGAGLGAIPESSANLGRGDLVVESNGKQYVIEVKVVPKSSQADAASINAINRIVDKGYDSLLPNPVLVGLGLSDENGRIDACVYVENDQVMRLEMSTGRAEVLMDFETLKRASRPEKTPKPKGPKPRGPNPCRFP
ncbi:MAG: ATP-binding protein [Deltaproteobacteria bacterium]|jgi:hypothetical protein|nr:ATP-binding protein [Deltaproteobacteria bacterium]